MLMAAKCGADVEIVVKLKGIVDEMIAKGCIDLLVMVFVIILQTNSNCVHEKGAARLHCMLASTGKQMS